ncbi:MAG: aldehyde dehydrogenase family protein, partial [Thermoplasmata archaeon]
MKLKTINPANEEVIAEYDTMPREEVFAIAKACNAAFRKWRDLYVSQRAPYFLRLAKVLRENKGRFARLMTTEMGKPIKEARAEVEKCAWTAEVFADKAEDWLREETVEADGKKHVVSY